MKDAEKRNFDRMGQNSKSNVNFKWLNVDVI